MFKVYIVYSNYHNKDLDRKISSKLGKQILEAGFNMTGERILRFSFLSEKATKTIKTQLKTICKDCKLEINIQKI